MQIEDPRRLATFLLIIAAIVFGAWYFLLRDDEEGASSPNQDTPGAATVPAPEEVQEVVDATAAQPRYEVVAKGAGNSVFRRLIDTEESLSAFYNGDELTFLQRGDTTYSFNGEDCFFRSKQDEDANEQVVSNIATEFLPVGSAAIEYDIETGDGMKTITWKIETPDGAPDDFPSPSGSIVADEKTNVIQSARTSQGGEAQQDISIKYPESIEVPDRPKNICKD